MAPRMGAIAGRPTKLALPATYDRILREPNESVPDNRGYACIRGKGPNGPSPGTDRTVTANAASGYRWASD